MSKSKGVLACEMALERLITGNVQISGHVGINKENITPSTVSVEAGYDKGYLKRSRDIHKPLIARIDALKVNKNNSSNNNDKLKRLSLQNDKLKQELSESLEVQDKILTQNIMLLQKVRELEKEMERYSNVVNVQFDKS